MKKQDGFTLVELLYLSVIPIALAGAFGWVWNIVKLVSMSFDPLTGMAIARVIGVFVPPVGAVCGYL